MKSLPPVLRFFLELCLILLGVFGSLFCLTSAFSLPLPEEVWLIVPYLACFNCILLDRKKRGRIAALVLLFLLLIMLYVTWDVVAESFRNLWGELVTRFARGYDMLSNYLPEEATSPDATGAALLALVIAQTYLCSLAVRQWRMVLPAALSLLPGVLPCFVLTDTPPDLLPLMLVVFSLLTQAFSQSVRRRDLGEVVKSLALSALLSAAVLGVLLTCFPRETYQPPITWENLSQWMSKWSNERNNQGNLNAGLTGNPKEVELSALGALPNHPFTCLYARSSLDGIHYLRGSSYADFDGSVWRRGAAEGWRETDVFPYLGVADSLAAAVAAPWDRNVITEGSNVQVDVVYPEAASAGHLEIETVGVEPMLFTTYQLTSLPESAVIGDDYVRNPGELQVYSMDFLPSALPIFAAASTPSAYEQWVLQHCLSVPEETRAGVLAWWEQHGSDVRPLDADLSAALLGEEEPDTERFARDVAERISACAKYSRNPAHVPEGVDFSTWFLNEAESGYCVHFASACTALLRSLGVPARYVSGYVCTLTANKNTPVSNLQAHAWVEIWSAGRWVCIEPTPSDATEFTGRIAFSTPTTSESRPLPSDDPFPTEAPTTRPSQPVATTEAHSPEPEKTHVDLTALWCLLGVLGALALIVLRRTLALRRWHRRLSRADSNERTRLMYRRMLRLRALSGAEISENVVQLAQKATFSQHSITPPELEEMRIALKYQTARVSIAGFWKKLYAKYVLAIL